MNMINDEKKSRSGKQNNRKSGKQAARKEQRRLEAIARQVANVQRAEENAKKAKDKKKAEGKILHAKLTLQQIRGGKPHEELKKQILGG